MREGLLELRDVRLWHWDTGGDGPPIVLCHPASQSCQIWEHQRPALVAEGFRVVAYSRRGHFRSEHGPTDAPGTVVGDLLSLLDHLSITRAHVLGAAAGGITATAFAVAHPERVLSLVLAGTIVAPDEDDWRALYHHLGVAALRGIVPETFLELGPTYRATDPEGTQRFAQLNKLAHAGRPLRQPSGVKVTWAALEAMEISALLVTGEADLYAPPPLQAMVARHIRNHRLATLRECGHAPYWEQPAAFNNIVLAFLASLPASLPANTAPLGAA